MKMKNLLILVVSMAITLRGVWGATSLALDMSEGYVDYSLECLKTEYRSLIFAGCDTQGRQNNYVYANIKATERFDKNI